MSKPYVEEEYNPPEELIALANMFDIDWEYVKGYGARTWELRVYRRTLQKTHTKISHRSHRTQSVLYDDWVKVLDELIAWRDAP